MILDSIQTMAEIIEIKPAAAYSRGTFEYRQIRARNYLAEHNYDRIRMRKAMMDCRRAVRKLDLESLMNAQWTNLIGENTSEDARMSLDYIDGCIKKQIGEDMASGSSSPAIIKMDNHINTRILAPDYLSVDWDDIYTE